MRKVLEGTTAIAAIGLGTIGMVGIGALIDGGERIVARIVDFPLPQMKVVKIIPQERVLERFVEQIVVQAVPQIFECRPCPPSSTALPRVFC